MCSKTGQSIRLVLFFKVMWSKIMILVSSLKANIKHIGEKTIQRIAKSTHILSKKRKNFTSTTVWGRERWDMINEYRRETTQVGGV